MILIIDDDAAVRSSLSLLLKRAGHETHSVASPEAALGFVRHSTPDLMLMDMNFSLATKGDEGMELLQKVKIFCPQTPVILITAWGSIAFAGGRVRFYYQAVGQPPIAEIGGNRARFGRRKNSFRYRSANASGA